MALKHRIKTAIILAKLAGWSLGDKDEDDKGEYMLVRNYLGEEVMQTRRQRRETDAAWEERIWNVVGEAYIKIDWSEVMLAIQNIHANTRFEIVGSKEYVRLRTIEGTEAVIKLDVCIVNPPALALRDSMTMIAYLAVLEYYYETVFKLTEK